MSQSGTAGLVKAVIAKLWQDTPSVRGLQLKVSGGGFTFKPGQWVDFHAPGLSPAVIGGYSICSTPRQASQHGTVELSIKASSHPCAQWVHHQATVGDEVLVQVGGEFVLQESSVSSPCLFVAGGIGITALLPMIAHLAEQQQLHTQLDQWYDGPCSARSLPRPVLLYSASSPDEFARLPQLLQLHQMRAMTMHLFTTKRHGTPAAVTEVLQQQQQSQSSQGVADLVMQTGRIQQEHFQAALQQLQAGQAGQVSAYVCGPPVMTDQVGGLVVLPALSRQEATNQQQKQHLQASGMRVSVQLAVVHVSCVGGVQLCDAKMQQQGAVLLIDDAGASNPGSAGGAAKLPAC